MNSALRAHREEEGFTLIELLVVVIIIGILAAIAIPAFLNQRERAWQSELTSTVRNVALEVEAEATIFGGDYSQVDNGVDFAGFLTDELTELQGAAGPVTLTVGNVTTTEYCFIGTHAQLTGADGAVGGGDDPQQVFESDEGGLAAFDPDGGAACVD